MELEILTEAEAIERPAGKGREEPSALDPPQYVVLFISDVTAASA